MLHFMFMSPLLSLLVSSVRADGAIIGNGEVILGVTPYGTLNTPYRDVPSLGLNYGSDPVGIGLIGLRDSTGIFNAVEAGSPQEGWGASYDAPSGGDGGGYSLTYGFSGDLQLLSFTGTDGSDHADSVTKVGALKVEHNFVPSDSPYAFKVLVTLTNTGTETMTNVRYRRAMDFDIYPTQFYERVIIEPGTSALLERVCNNGFVQSIPSMDDYLCTYDGVENQPHSDDYATDQGASFQFNFGSLGAGQSYDFELFYGTAPDYDSAISALSVAGAETYALAMNGNADHRTQRNAFMGFIKIGGKAVLGCQDIAYAMMTECGRLYTCNLEPGKDVVVGKSFLYRIGRYFQYKYFTSVVGLNFGCAKKGESLGVPVPKGAFGVDQCQDATSLTFPLDPKTFGVSPRDKAGLTISKVALFCKATADSPWMPVGGLIDGDVPSNITTPFKLPSAK